MTAQKDIIADLYRGTFFILLMSMLATTLGNVIDGVIIGNLLGNQAMAAFGFTTPYQKFMSIFPEVLTLGMQIICSKKIRLGKLNESSGIFSLTVIIAMSLEIFFIAMTVIFRNKLQIYLAQIKIWGLSAKKLSIILFAPSMPIIALNMVLQSFYQACGKFKLSSFIATGSNILFIVPIVLPLTSYFGMDGFWAAFIVNQIVCFISVIFGVWIYRKKITFKLEDILLLPKDFYSAENPQINITVTSKDEVLKLAEQVQYFCRNYNIRKRKGMFAAICVEEMAANVIEHGFNDGKKHSIDIRVIISGENVTVRIRDDCRPFNPKKWQEIYNNEAPAAHIGINLVSKITTEFNYVNVLKLNNLIIKI